MERTPSFQVAAFGNYYLLERIAVGGMAEIFKARQSGVRGFEKIVVIKRILQHLGEDPEFVEMFEDEAKLAAQLNQANIVQIFELGEVSETLYITMEFVDGKNLRDVTRAASGRTIHLSVDQCVMIMSEVLKGMDYAHRKADGTGKPLLIVHRDISPQNIIISYEGEVKILDFGIAKAASKISKTEAGVLKGKFSYMSPEQASGKPIDQTSDIYATGVIFHELLTSERLFRSKSDMETLEKVKEGKVLPPSEKNPKVPQEIDRIVLKALSKNLGDRYKSAGEMLTDLNRFAFDQQYSYSSQDLSIFMKTLFSESIKEDKQRLQEALSKIPKDSNQQIQNARTHIAFKRDENPGLAETSVVRKDSESTQTFEKRSRARRPYMVLSLLIVAALASIIFLRLKPEPSAKPEHKATPVISVPDPDKPNPLSDKLDDTVGKIRPPEDPPNERFPDPTPIEPPPPATKEELKPEPSAPTKIPPKKSSPKPVVKPAQRLARINVTAPLEGFANLIVDGESKGTVPGPNARNIQLSPGTHSIRCETTSRIYSGIIKVKEGETLTVRCQDLK